MPGGARRRLASEAPHSIWFARCHLGGRAGRNVWRPPSGLRGLVRVRLAGGALGAPDQSSRFLTYLTGVLGGGSNEVEGGLYAALDSLEKE